MAKIDWNDELQLGISDVDLQHQKLVYLVNELHDAASFGKASEALDRVLASLIQYTQIHFAAEERLLDANGYPDLPQHRAEHEKLTVRLIDIRTKLHSGRLELTPPVMTFLDDWLVKHIIGMDKNYVEFLKSKGVI